MTSRTAYVKPADFDKLVGRLRAREGDVRIRRAVVVEGDGPMYYDGPVVLIWDEDDGCFRVQVARTESEALPRGAYDWKVEMGPRMRRLQLADDCGYYRVAVYDTLTEAGE